MTKEALEERLLSLKREQINHQQLVIAYGGAIQECEYWVEQLAQLALLTPSGD